MKELQWQPPVGQFIEITEFSDSLIDIQQPLLCPVWADAVLKDYGVRLVPANFTYSQVQKITDN